jgi:lysophospholipase L1-like esterase
VLAVAVIVVGGLALLPASLLSGPAALAAAWAPWGQPIASSPLAPDLHRSHPARRHAGARPGGAGPGGSPAAGPGSSAGQQVPGSSPASEQVPDSAGLAGCEDKIESGAAGGGLPRLAIVGASFTAGVGPGNPLQSWAVLLARQLRWDAVVYGDPGAGYVRLGVGRQGPMAAEIARIGLRALKPALVIVQAGHDDIGVPARLEKQRVEQTVALIHAAAPQARIALLTVFATPGRAAAAERTDRAIVTAGRAADRQVIIMDPLAGNWNFQRAHSGLHPSAAGDAWIAQRVDTILGEHGVLAQPTGRGAVICAGIPVRPRRV